MAQKVSRAFLLLFLILGLFAVGAWLHSYSAGWEHTWADHEGQQGGRLVSSQGQIFVQRCELKPHPVAQAMPSLQKGTHAEMPQGYAVGSNADGERTVIAIGVFPIPFARPDPGTFIGRANHFDSNIRFAQQPGEELKGQWWNANWQEWVIAYWLVALLLLWLPICTGVWWVFRPRKRETDGNLGDAGLQEKLVPKP